MTERELVTKLADPLWRLSNLYKIKNAEEGRLVPFRPRPEQQQIFEAVHVHKKRRIIILKARRLGMSTAIGVLSTDTALFNSGVQISIVDQTQDDASKKLNGICKIAFDGLPAPIKERYAITRSNDSSWELSVGETASSAVYAGKNSRGGTNQGLHISEWGPIQADDPRRSEEILTGALPSAEHGTVIIETTWKGGRNGLLYDRIVKPTLEGQGDWHLFFFPWWTDPTYTSETGEIDAEADAYFREMSGEIGQLTDGQKRWYAKKRQELGTFIYREFPSTLDECFRAPVDGAIYATSVAKLRAQGAIRSSAVDQTALVHTFWDRGSPANTVTWYVQFVGTEIRVIDVDMDLDLTPIERVARILSKGYNLGYHYLPHDCAATSHSGRTFQAELADAGLPNTRIIPRTIDIWIGINRLRQLMPRMTFRVPACQPGIEALENYHTRTDINGAIATDSPVHDWSSHPSDALRMLAEAEMAGMIQGGSATAVGSRRRVAPKVIMGLRG